MDFGMNDADMNEMWDMFMAMGGADGFMGDMGGMGKGKGKKGCDKGCGKGKKMGGGFDMGFGGDCKGFGKGFDKGGDCKGKGMMKGGMMKGGKPMIDPKVAAAIEQCIAEIEERENGGANGDLLAGAGIDISEINATGGGDPAIMSTAPSAPMPSAAPSMSGGGGGIPDIKRIELQQLQGGTLAAEGFPLASYGVEYSKEFPIFSESHTILNDLLFVPGKFDLTWQVEFVHDSDATVYPEVYQAWQAAGGSENLPCVAKCKELGKWAVGFGGKKNAERAAKLALSIAIGMDMEHAQPAIQRYRGFGQIIQALQGQLAAQGGVPGAFSPY